MTGATGPTHGVLDDQHASDEDGVGRRQHHPGPTSKTEATTRCAQPRDAGADGAGVTGTLPQILDEERRDLNHLRFRLVETRLLLVIGEIADLAVAAREVDQARQRVRATDLVRATTLADMDGAGTGHELLTLRQVAASSTPDESPVLRDHHEALCQLVAEIEVTAHRTAELARGCIRRLALAAEGAEAPLGSDVPETPSSPPDPELPVSSIASSRVSRAVGSIAHLGARRMDPPASSSGSDPRAEERALQDTIAVAGRLRMPALLAFLR